MRLFISFFSFFLFLFFLVMLTSTLGGGQCKLFLYVHFGESSTTTTTTTMSCFMILFFMNLNERFINKMSNPWPSPLAQTKWMNPNMSINTTSNVRPLSSSWLDKSIHTNSHPIVYRTHIAPHHCNLRCHSRKKHGLTI